MTAHNLRLPPTPLLGRDHDVAFASQLLERDEVRLLTLLGPAGVGKTRLALAVADRLRDDYPHGVWFVDLAPLDTPQSVVQAIARELGIRETRGRSLLQRLVRVLADQVVLLVLDNYERVRDAASLVADILAACPAVKILATSRAPLSLRWEHRYAVAPLDLPIPQRFRDPRRLDRPLPAAMDFFVARARAVQPDFALTAANAAAIAELCVRLDGLPLALELAAARSHVLAPQALLTSCAWLPTLSWPAADLPARQQSLRAAIDWSYALLDDAERALFRHLGVFVGGCTPEAAAAVAGDGGAAGVLDSLQGLVEQSLVEAPGAGDKIPRFRLLGVMREFALAQLAASGELAPAQERHAAYYLDLVERAAAALLGPERGDWVRRLDQEHDNLRAALDWAIAHEAPEVELRLVAALGHFWWTRGLLREGRRRLEGALARDGGGPSRPRAKALIEYTIPLMWQGDYDRARQAAEEALAIGRALGDGRASAESLVYLAWLADAEGDDDRASRLYAAALTESRLAHDAWSGALARMNLGGLRLHQKAIDEAESLLTEGLRLGREAGDIRLSAILLTALSRVACERGDFDAAVPALTEALVLCRRACDLRATYLAAVAAARLAVSRGGADRAAALLAALGLQHEIDRPTPSRAAVPLPPWPRAAVREVLAASPFAATWAQGESSALHQLVEEALAALTEVRADPDPAAGDLSERERDVLRLVAAGLPNKQIAQMLSLSERTVKAYLTSAMNKLGADNRAQAAVVAVQQQLL
ncbi:MAG TPA: LuxR C-terminal-related transcriptional regulator [Thermomicrobiales bacterium]|nr:LuxR C-terminal-related transcriptional regulator [Thermomicrobiales bacterium]